MSTRYFGLGPPNVGARLIAAVALSAALVGPVMAQSIHGTATSSRPLEKTYWKATELDGKPVPAAQSTREVHIILGGSGRVGGSDGCNRIIGSYTLTGDAIKFGALAGTEMACPDTADTERGLRKALSGAARWSIAGDRLDLLDATGGRLARFEALEGRDR